MYPQPLGLAWLWVCEYEKTRKLPQVHCHPLSSMRVRIELLTQASSTLVRRSSPYFSIPMLIIFSGSSLSPNFCSSGPQIEDWCFKQSILLFLLPASVAATWHNRRLCLVGKLTSSLWCWWYGSRDGQCISLLRCRCHVVLCKNKNNNLEPILDKAREVHSLCFSFFIFLNLMLCAFS